MQSKAVLYLKISGVIFLIPEIESGSTYKDFDPGIDNLAAWTIGGLVGGKVLAKAGFFVLLLKFWKITMQFSRMLR